MKKNSEFRAMARGELKGEWTQPILATLLYILIACIGAVTVGGKVSIILYIVSGVLLLGITMPMFYTYTQKFLEFVRGEKEDVAGGLFDFFNHYLRAWLISFLQALFIALWSLLLIVPGVIKALSYSLTNFVAKDNPELSPMECIEMSEEMMRGHKMQLFKLFLSFIGWYLLAFVTLGIGLLWVMPYTFTSWACFYEEVRLGYLAKGVEASR